MKILNKNYPIRLQFPTNKKTKLHAELEQKREALPCVAILLVLFASNGAARGRGGWGSRLRESQYCKLLHNIRTAKIIREREGQ